MQFEFLVPGLLDSPSAQRIREYAPALATLLKRASVAEELASSLESWIARRFGCDANEENFPFAAVASRADRNTDCAAKYWLRADPVHLSVNRDRIVLLDASQLDVTAVESTALVASMQAHFESDALTFSAPHPRRWYIASDKPFAIRTHCVSAVRGRNVADYWFDGADRALWQTRLSEMQMLLHAHPVNDAREAAGQLQINGVWFWGEGEMPAGLKHPYVHIVADDVLLKGIASLTSSQFTDTHQFEWRKVTAAAPGTTLVALGQLADCAAYGEWDTWQNALTTLDQNWFAPALSALKIGKLKTLTICAPSKADGNTLTINGIDLFKFWRRFHAT